LVLQVTVTYPVEEDWLRVGPVRKEHQHCWPEVFVLLNIKMDKNEITQSNFGFIKISLMLLIAFKLCRIGFSKKKKSKK
jgi:hypothetical protein